jgi:hypothetical protein
LKSVKPEGSAWMTSVTAGLPFVLASSKVSASQALLSAVPPSLGRSSVSVGTEAGLTVAELWVKHA